MIKEKLAALVSTNDSVSVSSEGTTLLSVLICIESPVVAVGSVKLTKY